MLFKGNDGGSEITALTLDMSDGGNATFNGDITVSGGDITLGGTGRIQGIDTVSASTDAASKGYVDTQVGLFDTLSEVLANGNTTGGTDIAVSANDDITFTNSSKAIFGGSSDLQVYSDGSNNYIDSTSNELRIRSNDLRLLNYGTAKYITADSGADVSLYHNDSKKFQTTSSGIEVTGGATFSGDVSINSTSSPAKNLVVEGDSSAYATIRVLSNSTGHGAEIEFGDSSDADYGSITQFASSAGEGGRMRFRAGGTETMNLRGGVVGIGTNNPTSPTSVAKFLEIEGATAGIVLHDSDVEAWDLYASGGKLGTRYNNSANGWWLDSSGRMGIGITGPSDYDADADNLVLGDTTGNTGITIVSGASAGNYGSIYFADGTSSTAAKAGYIRYEQNTSEMTFGINAVEKLSIALDGTATFAGSIIANDTSKIEKAQVTTQFDTSSFLRLHPSATTNSGGYTNMIFGTDTANNYGVAIGGKREGTDGTPAFSMRMLNDSITGTEVLNISNSGTATFSGDLIIPEYIKHSGDTDTSIRFSTNNIKFYTANNEVLELEDDGQVNIISAGTATNPCLTIGDDVNTGIWRPASDTFAISTGGNERMRITSAGAVEIKGSSTTTSAQAFITNDNSLLTIGSSVSGRVVKDIQFSSPSAMMYIDGSTSNVGIGNTNPTAKLTIDNNISTTYSSTGYAATPSNSMLYLNNTNGGSDTASLINFRTGSGDGVLGFVEGGGTNDADFIIQTDGGSNGIERFRINNAGEIQIGGTTNAGFIDFDSTNLQLNTQRNPNTGSFVNTGKSHATIALQGADGGSKIIFGTNASNNATATVRMTITDDGSVLIGTTTNQGVGGVSIDPNSDPNPTVTTIVNNTSVSGAELFVARYNSTQVGSISLNGTTGTNFNTSSDYRLKENVVEMTDALDRVSQLKPSRFNFIADEDKTVDGFLAHEVQDIVPEAITGEKDEMRTEEYEESPAVYEEIVHEAQDAIEWEDKPTMDNTKVEIQEWLDDNEIEWQSADTKQELLDRIPEYQQEAQEESTERVLVSEAVMATREVPVYQGIDQSKLVPLLVGAIKEQQEIINDLKARIENLEN